ncbi:Cysteine/serine-rich nuclear protein 2 [Merluccius polli]|uniref:Cysteine/serine-rich nuclear protein 2 n=1 Tax=Merluccius polli TaxID=89951 RepID=A0AA47N8I5_MERPO|nr:Cysteine/serine-rich nuclear protein 2 [Merluccius polli]
MLLPPVSLPGSMEAGSSLGLKRRYEEVDHSSAFSTPKDSDDEVSSSDSADSCDSLNPPSGAPFAPTSILRRHKPPPGGKRVRFDLVTVYFFPRRQGFTSVPSQGGSSLGMARHHSSIRHFTLGEFAREQESSHRHTLRQHLRQEKLNARKMKLTHNGTVASTQADLLTLDDVSDEDPDAGGVEVDDCFFLQPLPTKRRRALLRASGVARIDAREKAELRAIRLSREECGCDCRLYCDPRRCGCSRAGIKCQFNPLRVRTHYLHTIMNLGLEKRILGPGGGGEQYPADGDLLLSPSSTCPPSPELPCSSSSSSSSSSLSVAAGGPDFPLEEVEAEEVEAVVAVHNLLAERDILERENETAVLHLQSAEEQERREREEAEASGLGGEQVEVEETGVEQVLLQGSFPTGAAALCMAETPPEEEPASLLYYQLTPVQPGSSEPPEAQEEEEEVGGAGAGGEKQEQGGEGGRSDKESGDAARGPETGAPAATLRSGVCEKEAQEEEERPPRGPQHNRSGGPCRRAPEAGGGAAPQGDVSLLPPPPPPPEV